MYAVSLRKVAAAQERFNPLTSPRLSEFQAVQGGLSVLSIKSWPRGTLLSKVITNIHTSCSFTNEISFCPQVGLDWWSNDSAHSQPTSALWSWGFPHILGPLLFGLRLSISRKQTHTICPFVPIFNDPSVSLFLAYPPLFQSFSDQENVLSKLQLGRQRDGFWPPKLLRWSQRGKGRVKKY